MKHYFLRISLIALLVGGLVVASPPAFAQKSSDFGKGSPQIVKAFAPVVAGPSQSTVRIRCNGKDVALGTITGANGWILTKAGQLEGNIVCRLKDGRELPAVIVGVHKDCDLAMLKIEATGLKPVTWSDSKVATVGRWAASVAPAAEPVALGVFSVATRAFKPGDQPPKNPDSKTGYLGVFLEEGNGGAKVKSVEPRSPAAKAGIKVNDIVTHVNKKAVVDMESLINAVGRHKPGAEITLKINRGKEKVEVKAKLASRPFTGNPQELMGSTLSKRRGGFPAILQHDTVLRPIDCGGPVVDLDGKVVGINIARAGRTETYALPTETIRELLADLMSGNLPPAPKEE